MAPVNDSKSLGNDPAPAATFQKADTVLATVDGRPIGYRYAVEFLLKGPGPRLLEQLIVLEAAVRLAGEKGLSVSDADVDQEYELALRRLADPLSSITSGPPDRQQAERLLEAVLQEQQMSRAEFLLGMRRNAHLRKLVQTELAVSEEDLAAEFQRVYGRRVQVRHIQLATPAEAARIRERLAEGADFAELARRHSANTASAKEGGLLEPFSASDEEVPALFRETAFRLPPGGISDAVRIGEWYHLLKQERTLPAESRDPAEVRFQLEQECKERLSQSAMQRLYERLFKEADVRIHDPLLKEAFESRFPNRTR